MSTDVDADTITDGGTIVDAMATAADGSITADAMVTIPDGAILPETPVSKEETRDESCPNTCILADGTCARENATSNDFCGRPGASCLASCASCDGRYDSLNFPIVYEMPPTGCDDCVSFEHPATATVTVR